MKHLLPAVILLAGCASFRSTPADKAASVIRYETADTGVAVTGASGRVIKLKPTGHLSLMTAWVLGSDETDADKLQARLAGTTTAGRAASSAAAAVMALPAGMGGAVAVSPDGYFLTAAHLVAFRSCWAAYLSGVHPATYQFVKARVVFADPAADLALIKIGMATPRFLEIQDVPGEVAGVVVFSGHLGTLPSAGEILASQQRRFPYQGKPVTYQRLKIQIPIMPGDSGGPVVDAQGRFRGILTDEIYGLGWQRPHRAYASLPSRAFLSNLIATDRLTPQ